MLRQLTAVFFFFVLWQSATCQLSGAITQITRRSPFVFVFFFKLSSCEVGEHLDMNLFPRAAENKGQNCKSESLKRKGQRAHGAKIKFCLFEIQFVLCLSSNKCFPPSPESSNLIGSMDGLHFSHMNSSLLQAPMFWSVWWRAALLPEFRC